VLVVDDYAATLESIRRLLQTDHQVYEASSGEDAVRIAIREKPDVALIDYRLPGMNGVQTAAAIRQAGLDMPWVLFSGLVNDRVTSEAAALGAVNVVWSPFDPREIIRDVLKRRGPRPTSKMARNTVR
jgi:two-component system NtrC family response regulator/two-component system nitrogen regulation response regulator GlnG